MASRKENLLSQVGNRGVTIIELAVVIVIMSTMLLGLFPGVVTIIKYYQNDWILREIRSYGYESMDYMTSEMARAEKINIDSFNGYSTIRIKYRGISQITNIQANEIDGLFVGTQPMLKHRPFPVFGLYRDDNAARQIKLKTFECNDLNKTKNGYSNSARSGLTKVNRAVFDILMEIEMITPIPDADDIVEIIRFHRQVFVPQMI